MDSNYKSVKQGFANHYNHFSGCGGFYTPTIGSGNLESYIREIGKDVKRVKQEQGEVTTYYLSEEELKKYK